MLTHESRQSVPWLIFDVGQRKRVKAEMKFLGYLSECGYFASGSFDPQPVFAAARKHLGIHVTSVEENERLTTVIDRMVQDGIVRVEYSEDQTLHPKDQLDHWRLLLMPAGLAALGSR